MKPSCWRALFIFILSLQAFAGVEQTYDLFLLLGDTDISHENNLFQSSSEKSQTSILTEKNNFLFTYSDAKMKYQWGRDSNGNVTIKSNLITQTLSNEEGLVKSTYLSNGRLTRYFSTTLYQKEFGRLCQNRIRPSTLVDLNSLIQQTVPSQACTPENPGLNITNTNGSCSSYPSARFSSSRNDYCSTFNNCSICTLTSELRSSLQQGLQCLNNHNLQHIARLVAGIFQNHNRPVRFDCPENNQLNSSLDGAYAAATLPCDGQEWPNILINMRSMTALSPQNRQEKLFHEIMHLAGYQHGTAGFEMAYIAQKCCFNENASACAMLQAYGDSQASPSGRPYEFTEDYYASLHNLLDQAARNAYWADSFIELKINELQLRLNDIDSTTNMSALVQEIMDLVNCGDRFARQLPGAARETLSRGCRSYSKRNWIKAFLLPQILPRINALNPPLATPIRSDLANELSREIIPIMNSQNKVTRFIRSLSLLAANPNIRSNENAMLEMGRAACEQLPRSSRHLFLSTVMGVLSDAETRRHGNVISRLRTSCR